MKRSDFIQIIKLRSFWQIDKRKGNYKLPSGKELKDYIRDIVESQMDVDNLLIKADGDLCFGSGGDWNNETKTFSDYTLTPPFEDNEVCSYIEMQRRISYLVFDIIE